MSRNIAMLLLAAQLAAACDAEPSERLVTSVQIDLDLELTRLGTPVTCAELGIDAFVLDLVLDADGKSLFYEPVEIPCSSKPARFILTELICPVPIIGVMAPPATLNVTAVRRQATSPRPIVVESADVSFSFTEAPIEAFVYLRAGEACGDGDDDDGDGRVDCDDDECREVCTDENCTNGADDDNDGLVDCFDLECRREGTPCIFPAVAEDCQNGQDDDGDTLVDCDDPDCAGLPGCATLQAGAWSFPVGPTNGDERFRLVYGSAAGRYFVIGPADRVYETVPDASGPFGASAAGLSWSGTSRALYDAITLPGGELVAVTTSGSAELWHFDGFVAGTQDVTAWLEISLAREPHALAARTGGGFAVGGRVTSDGSVFVTLLDAARSVESDHVYTATCPPMTPCTPAIERLEAGGAGELYAAGALGARGLVMRLAADGTIVWQKLLVPPAATASEAHVVLLRDLVVLPGGDLVVVGEARRNVLMPVFAIESALIVARYDGATGALEWVETLATPSSTIKRDLALDVLVSTAGGEHLVIAGTAENDMLLAELTPDGATLTRARRLGLAGETESAEGVLEDLATGAYVVSGRGPSKFWLAMVDASFSTGACGLDAAATLTLATAPHTDAAAAFVHTVHTVNVSAPTRTAATTTATLTDQCP